MARTERNDVDYFPHPVKHGKGMFYMRTKYGNDAYVVWFMLLEKLGAAEHHYLDLKNELQLMYLSAEFKVDEKVLVELIHDLVKVSEGDFNSELWEEERILYNEKFVDSIADAYKKRKNSIVELNTLLLLLASKGRIKRSKLPPNEPLGNLKVPGNTQSIVKESKVKDSITLFNDFWYKYHVKTGKPKTDKEAALKYWKKLTEAEMNIAIEMIIKYSNSLSDKRFCKKARTYLADKNFNDEFQTNQGVRSSVSIKRFDPDDRKQ